MNSNTRKKIESVVLSNMGVTEEEFKSWKIKDYSCDRICSTYIMSRFLEKTLLYAIFPAGCLMDMGLRRSRLL